MDATKETIAETGAPADQPTTATTKLAIAVAWLAVGLPLLWGIGETFAKVLPLFRI